MNHSLGLEAGITLLVLIIVLFMLMRYRRSPDAVLWGGVGILLLIPLPHDSSWQIGVMQTDDALKVLANEGMATIALLFVVACGLNETGALRMLLHRALGSPKSLLAAQNRILLPTAAISGFMNNTPLVAMMLPVTEDWARRHNISVSRLLMPLSFASILGGACTLVGTSTNLIVNGWIIDKVDSSGLGMFEVSVIALPIAIVGLIYIFIASPLLLPDRRSALSTSDGMRQYTTEMIVEENSSLVGQSIEDAGLRGLPGLFLIEIDRDTEILPAVSANVQLKANDRLVFAGLVDSVADLQKIPGLRPATNQLFKLDEPRHKRLLVEAVVSESCPLVGRSIKEGRFRTVYNAAIIAVARSGQRMNEKIGDIVLQPGDNLLLEARPNFIQQQKNRSDFYLVSQIDESVSPDYSRAPYALAILTLMVVLVTLGIMSMMQSSMLAGGLMILSGCCTVSSARRAIDWQVLMVIAAALALGNAMEVSGLAEYLGHGIQHWFGHDPELMLFALFGFSMLLASMVTAKAAVVLMLPIAIAASAQMGVSEMPFLIAVMMAASTTIMTPIGYPTNLMVYGPGGYVFTDFLRFGAPLTLIIWMMCVFLIPVFWPFAG